MASSPEALSRFGKWTQLAALTIFAGLAVLHTWPLATAPGRLSRNDTADTVLHEWIMAWVAHQIVADPRRLFDANIFYPEYRTLTYSDHLFVQSLLGAPLRWTGASPVLVHNLVLLAGFALTGWATWFLMVRWTGSRTAGLVSGSLVAFNSFTLTRLPQIQDQHLEFFPLALLALDRLLVTPRVRHAATLAGWFILQSLTGTYVMVFSFLSLVAATLARAKEWIGPRFGSVAGQLALAAAGAGLALLPFMAPYYRAAESVGLGRSLEETTRYSAEFTDYLAAAGRVHFELWSRPFFEGDALFPGLAALVLAAIAVVAVCPKDARARMTLAFGVTAFALSFGPKFPPYGWLYDVFPPLTGIRGAVRFGQFVLIALAILAGFGVAVLQRRFHRRLLVPVSIACVLTVNVEALRAPMSYSEFRGIPPIYGTLDQLDRGSVVAAFPFYASHEFHRNASLMLAMTGTFHRMLNGYSGFKPASYYEHVRRLSTFPDEPSLRYLQDLGVSMVLVDGRQFSAATLARLSDFPELALWRTDGNLRIYQLAQPRSIGLGW